MATITSSGSVLDVNSLVTQLIAAEAAQKSAPITRHETAVTTKISALGSLKGALSTFKTALESLKTVSAFETRKATVADTDYFSVTTTTTAVAGHYDVEVANLAQAHQLTSEEFDGGSTATVGYGDLTISLAGESFTVTIDQDNATLADIRDAINAASDNPGVRATLLNGSGGATLILTSAQTGEDNVIEVAASGGDGGLDQLTYDPDVVGVQSMTEQRQAKDALIHIAGVPVTSTTNVFANAIDGVTITAKKATELNEPVGLDIALDTASITSRIQKFVADYNSMQATMTKLGGYNAETKVAGQMVGDAMLRGIQEQVRRDLSNPVTGLSGNYTTLASIGITSTAKGVLEVSTDKLTAALAADPEAVAQLFGSEDGVAARMFEHLEQKLGTTGEVETRNKGLSNELKDIAKDKEQLNLRLARIEARYRKQFVALDGLLTQMQGTSSYLAQQLANLPKIGE